MMSRRSPTSIPRACAAGRLTATSNEAEPGVGQTPVTYVDIHGTYLYKFPPFDPNAKVTPLPEYRRLAVVFDSKNGPYFITLTGPARTVAANKMPFDTWLGGFKK